jgi:hypothetical protein
MKLQLLKEEQQGHDRGEMDTKRRPRTPEIVGLGMTRHSPEEELARSSFIVETSIFK